jgi:hypothetical protein
MTKKDIIAYCEKRIERFEENTGYKVDLGTAQFPENTKPDLWIEYGEAQAFLEIIEEFEQREGR